MISSPGSISNAAANTASAGVQPGVAITCATPSASANARSNRPIMSHVRPLSTTSCRYVMQLGPIVRGNEVGRAPVSWACAAAPYFARSIFAVIYWFP